MVSAKKFAFLIGIAVFLYILSLIDLGSVLQILLAANPFILALALLLLCILIFFKGLKWKLILESQGKRLPVLKGAKYFCIGFFYSIITPGRLGDFVRAFYIKDIAPLPLAFSSLVLDRLMDVLLLVVFAAIGSFYFFETMGASILPMEFILLFLAGIVAVSFLLFKEKYMRMILRPFFGILVPENAKKKLSMGFSDFFAAIKLVLSNKNPFLLAVCVSILFWFFEIVFAYLLALSIGIEIPFVFMVFLYPLVVLGDLIPVSVSGLGTRDAILVAFFSLMGLSSESAVALSLLIFVTSYLLVALAGFLFSLGEPVELKMILTE